MENARAACFVGCQGLQSSRSPTHLTDGGGDRGKAIVHMEITYLGDGPVHCGLMTGVGDGASINPFKNPWILGLQSGCIVQRGQPIAQVSQLISPTRTWNLDLLDTTVLPFEKYAIVETPIPTDTRSDSLFWHFDQKRIFTVRSA